MSTNTWVAWVLMVMVVALSTTNPLYLTVILMAVLLVAVTAPKGGSAAAGIRALSMLGASLFVLSLFVAVINGNAGDHTLFTIPGPEVPSWLGGLRLGGPVTAEGLVAAATRGEGILCVFLGFAIFNGVARPHLVLRSAPAALFHAGLVVTVGLNLLPASIEDVRRIREMRALRGGSTGLRQLPALVVPAVIGGLERSMKLAEAMEARGFATAPPAPRAARLFGLASVPLLLISAWVFVYFPDRALLALPVMAAAAVAGGLWLKITAAQRRTTRLHNDPLPASDRAFIAFAFLVAAVSFTFARLDWFDLGYNPFAGLPAPGFSLFGALPGLACAFPALNALATPAKKARSVDAAPVDPLHPVEGTHR